MNDSIARFQRPEFTWTDTPPRTTRAFLAFLASSALLGGLLGLFEMQSNGAAMKRAAALTEAATSTATERVPQAGARTRRPAASLLAKSEALSTQPKRQVPHEIDLPSDAMQSGLALPADRL